MNSSKNLEYVIKTIENKGFIIKSSRLDSDDSRKNFGFNSMLYDITFKDETILYYLALTSEGFSLSFNSLRSDLSDPGINYLKAIKTLYVNDVPSVLERFLGDSEFNSIVDLIDTTMKSNRKLTFDTFINNKEVSEIKEKNGTSYHIYDFDSYKLSKIERKLHILNFDEYIIENKGIVVESFDLFEDVIEFFNQ